MLAYLCKPPRLLQRGDFICHRHGSREVPRACGLAEVNEHAQRDGFQRCGFVLLQRLPDRLVVSRLRHPGGIAGQGIELRESVTRQAGMTRCGLVPLPVAEARS